jgi:hypothetical protein
MSSVICASRRIGATLKLRPSAAADKACSEAGASVEDEDDDEHEQHDDQHAE